MSSERERESWDDDLYDWEEAAACREATVLEVIGILRRLGAQGRIRRIEDRPKDRIRLVADNGEGWVGITPTAERIESADMTVYSFDHGATVR